MSMKSEAEIRAHLRDLRVAMAAPCNCRATGHELQCRIGLKMMKATADTLAWALGENLGFQTLVDRMARDVRDVTASG